MALDPYSGAICWNNMEGGTNGTTVSTGNSGGASGTAFSGVQIAGTGTLTYSSTSPIHDTMSMVVAAVGGITIARWDSAVVGSRTELYGALYVSWAAWPSGYTAFMEAKQTDGGVLSFRLKVSSAGNVRLTDTTDATVWSSAAALSLNTTYRFEWHINCSTGAYDVWWYAGDSTTAIDTRSGTGSFGSTIAQVNYGRAASPDHTTKYDTLALSLTKLGPRAVPGNTALPYVAVSNAGAFTATGGTSLAVVRDGSDATYMQSPDAPVNKQIRYKLQPLGTTDVVTVKVRGSVTNSSQAIERTVSLYNGATLIGSNTYTLTTTPTWYNTVTDNPVTAGVEIEVLINDDLV